MHATQVRLAGSQKGSLGSAHELSLHATGGVPPLSFEFEQAISKKITAEAIIGVDQMRCMDASPR